MRKRIEVVSLSPAVDPLTMQPKSALVLRFKTETGAFEQLELEGSQKQILEMLKIDNFSDIVGRKIDVDMELKDGKMRIMGFSVVDDRQISYQDFERLQSAVFEMHGIIKSLMNQPFPQYQASAPVGTTQTAPQSVPTPVQFQNTKQG